MDILHFVNEWVFSFVEAIGILLFFILLNNNKYFIIKNMFKSFLFLILYTVFSYWATMYIPVGIHTIFITVFIVIALSYITNTNIYASTISVGITFIIITLIEYVILVIGISLFRLELNSIISIPIYRLYFLIAINILKFITILLMYRIKINIFKLDIFQRENSLATFIILQVFIMSTFILSLNHVVSHPANILMYNVSLLIIYFLFIFICYLDIKERERLIKLKHKYKLQEEYVNNMETVVSVIRREKHDFANHLNTILAMCLIRKPDTYDKMHAYILKLGENVQKSYRFFDTGNDYVDGLLAVKSNYAFENDIHMEVDVEAPIRRAEVRDNDLTSIIGNIVDNAFEAIMGQADWKGAVVSFCTYIEDDRFFISIADNGPGIPKDSLNKVFQNGFSTKTKKKEDHGFGLYIVKKMVDRNKGKITINSTEDETEFLIEFKLMEDKNGESSKGDNKRDSEGESQSQRVAT